MYLSVTTCTSLHVGTLKYIQDHVEFWFSEENLVDDEFLKFKQISLGPLNGPGEICFNFGDC